jgi:exonuclease SbcC
MNFIKRLEIENFQSHQKTVCMPAASGQLTVITGPSDTGKTVILRALRWLLFNEPQGSDFIRVGASFIRVTAEMESGHVVIRERTKATNRYKIIAPGDDGPQMFEGFGSSVPLEVREITGVRPVAIGDLNINLNLAEQLDGPFLGKSISAGARAKVLGKLAGTEEIDFAGKQLGTDLYRRNQDEKRLKSEVAGIEEEIKEYDWLPGAAKKIEALEKLAAEIKGTIETQSKLSRLKEQLFQVDEKVTAIQAVLYRWRNLEQAEKTLVDAIENKHSKEELIKLAVSYRSYQESILTCEKIITQHARLPKAEERLRAAQERSARAKLLHNLRAGFFAWQEIVRHNQGVLKKLEMLNTAETLLQDLGEKKRSQKMLKSLSSKWIVANAAVVGTQMLTERLSGVKEAGIKAAQVAECRAQWAVLSVLKIRCGSILNKIDAARGKAVLWENRVAELEGAYHDLFEDLNVCPLCGQEIKSKVKEAV